MDRRSRAALLVAAGALVAAAGGVVVAAGGDGRDAVPATSPSAAQGVPAPATTAAARTASAQTQPCPAGAGDLRRFAGGDRIATAVAVSSALWQRADHVLVASARAFPDALAAAALAARRDAPILLSEPDRLPAATAAEIERLAPSTVTVVGGTAAVSERVAAAIGALAGTPDVARVAGPDRYATAAALAVTAGASGSGEVVVTSGESFPDALAAAALAASDDRVPALLTPRAALHPAARDAVRDLGASTAVIVGGTAVVAPAVEQALVDAGLRVTRLAGADRYASAATVSERALARGPGDGVLLATGADFPDALAAGAAAARQGATLALVPPGDLDHAPALRQLLDRHRDQLRCNAVVGGRGAVPIRVAEQIAARLDRPPPDGPVRILAAGDIAWCGGDPDERTAKVLDAHPDPTILTLGDNAYEKGTSAQFRDCFEPTWGRHKHRIRPSLGNHDYGTPGAAPYFDYFGTAAGPRGKGWYAFELGPDWLAIALNSNCTIVACGPGSEQERWLRQVLADHPDDNVLAFWHHARFSSGRHGSDARADALWRALHEGGADLVLVGHEHDYERLGPVDVNGKPDPDGLRQIVVGTGGAVLRPFDRAPLAATERRSASSHGVLEVVLEADGYRFRFLPVTGAPLDDQGTGRIR